jgi:hypothetical protein
MPPPSSRARPSLLLLTLAVLLAAGCSDPNEPAVATQLGFTVQPASIGAGQFIPDVRVAVQDADGNTITTANIPVTIALGSNPSGGTLTGTTLVVSSNGIATFSNLRILDLGAGYTLVASAPGLSGATSAAFTVSPAVPTKLGFLVQPDPTARAGEVLSPAVQVAVQDGFGNTVTTASRSITIDLVSSGGANLSGTKSALTVNGVATFSDLSVNLAGIGYTLTASAPALTTATSEPFLVEPAAASKLGFIGQPFTARPGTAISPAFAVAVQDQFGNTVPTATPNVTVAIGQNPGNGTLSGTTTIAAVAGVASFGNLSIDNPANAYTLVATSAGLSPGVSGFFAIRNPLVFASISSGYFHSCGLTTLGTAYCWGDNSVGQIGAPVGTRTDFPVAVSGGLAFTGIGVGRTYTCGVAAGNQGYCWGQLHGTSGIITTPTAIPGGLSFASAVAGYEHACGVTTTGAGYCWGSNTQGALGNGTQVNSTPPVPVSGGLTFARISPGRVFSCGVTTAGAAYCWGINGGGYLGEGTGITRLVPIAVVGGLTFATVGAGGFHSCGLTTAGKAWCWGENSFGQLGSGAGSTTLVPKEVSGNLTFVSLTVGNRHSCGVTAAGVGYCWGGNGEGALGTGNLTNSPVPIAVAGGHTWASLSAGRFHTCGVTTAGAGYCWGGAGLIGDGTIQIRLLPTAVQ